MTPREALDTLEERLAGYDDRPVAEFRERYPDDVVAIDALRVVLDKHSEFRIFDECGHRHAPDDDRALSVENVGLTCGEGYRYSICRECCTSGSQEYQTAECCDNHDHGACWPCNTVTAISSALEAS